MHRENVRVKGRFAIMVALIVFLTLTALAVVSYVPQENGRAQLEILILVIGTVAAVMSMKNGGSEYLYYIIDEHFIVRVQRLSQKTELLYEVRVKDILHIYKASEVKIESDEIESVFDYSEKYSLGLKIALIVRIKNNKYNKIVISASSKTLRMLAELSRAKLHFNLDEVCENIKR